MPEPIDDIDSGLRRGAHARRQIVALGFLHALLTLVFGAGLIVSGIQGKIVGSRSYDLLATIPWWPESVGVAMVIIAAAKLWLLGLRGDIQRARPLFMAAAVIWAGYAGLFVVGTLKGGGIYGPQALYVAVAIAAVLITTDDGQ